MKYSNSKIIVLIFLYFISVNLIGKTVSFNPEEEPIDIHEAANLGTKYEAYTKINFYLYRFDFEKAEVLIDAYLAKNPDDPFILAEKAYLLKDIKNEHEEAVKVLKKIQRIYPGYYYANYLMGSLLYLYRDADKVPGMALSIPPLDEALKYLEISIKNNGKFFDSLFLCGAILSDKGKPIESNRCLEKALAVKQTAEPYFFMANNYRQLKDTEKEIQTYKKILTYIPYDPRSLTEISNYLLKHGDLKGAAGYLERLALKYPEDKTISTEYLQVLFGAREVEKFLEVSDTVDISSSPFLLFARAYFLGEKERFTEAIKLLKEVKEKDAKMNLLLADLYKRKKDYFDALQTVQGIAAGDRDFLFYSLYLEVLSMLDLNRQVLNVFAEIKNKGPLAEKLSLSDYYIVIYAYCNLNLTTPLLETLAWIKTKLKSKEDTEVLDELIKLIEDSLNGKRIETNNLKFDINIYLLINLYKNQEKYNEAIALLRDLIKKETGTVPYLEMCDIYITQKKPTAVEVLIKEMRQLFTGAVEVDNLHAYFLALENKELKKALALSKVALAKDVETAAYLDTYGYILFKIGKINEAVVYLEKAYWKNPFEPEIMEHLVNCYRLLKDRAKVIEIYRRAIDHNVDFKERLLKKIKSYD